MFVSFVESGMKLNSKLEYLVAMCHTTFIFKITSQLVTYVSYSVS